MENLAAVLCDPERFTLLWIKNSCSSVGVCLISRQNFVREKGFPTQRSLKSSDEIGP